MDWIIHISYDAITHTYGWKWEKMRGEALHFVPESFPWTALQYIVTIIPKNDTCRNEFPKLRYNSLRYIIVLVIIQAFLLVWSVYLVLKSHFHPCPYPTILNRVWHHCLLYVLVRWFQSSKAEWLYHRDTELSTLLCQNISNLFLIVCLHYKLHACTKSLWLWKMNIF
jgi:hypothetical protein